MDNLEAIPPYREGFKTFLDFFEDTVKKRPDGPFIGYRPKQSEVEGKPVFGEYQWMSYKQIQ